MYFSIKALLFAHCKKLHYNLTDILFLLFFRLPFSILSLTQLTQFCISISFFSWVLILFFAVLPSLYSYLPLLVANLHYFLLNNFLLWHRLLDAPDCSECDRALEDLENIDSATDRHGIVCELKTLFLFYLNNLFLAFNMNLLMLICFSCQDRWRINCSRVRDWKNASIDLFRKADSISLWRRHQCRGRRLAVVGAAENWRHHRICEQRASGKLNWSHTLPGCLFL